MNHKIIYLIATLLFLTSCDKEIEYHGDETTPKLVINALLEADSTILVDLSKSYFFLDNQEATDINNGHIEITINEAETITLTDMGNGQFTSDRILKEGDYCKLKAWADSFTPVTATTSIPQKAKVELISLNKEKEKIILHIKLTDIPNQTNAYSITTEVTYSSINNDSTRNTYTVIIHGGTSASIEKPHELYNDESDALPFFTDQLFQDKEAEITVECNNNLYEDMIEHIFINLQTLSMGYYYYLSSMSQYENNRFNPFSEPVQIYSNIDNGIGIFESFTTNRLQVYPQ